jgi:hypothetical protein
VTDVEHELIRARPTLAAFRFALAFARGSCTSSHVRMRFSTAAPSRLSVRLEQLGPLQDTEKEAASFGRP